MAIDPSRPLRILIVDDDEYIREIALMCLARESGFDARAVGSGAEAIQMAGDWQPDLILLDVVMPHMDGPTTAQRLAGSLRTRGIPVVFLSARSDTDEIVRQLALPIAGIIAKPFNPIALPELVRGHIAGAH